MNHATDTELLRAYVEERSERAFTELVRRHVDLVYSVARRTQLDSHLAEDVAQAVFRALAVQAPNLTKHPVLAGWLHRTARNIAAQTVRTECRRRSRENEASIMNINDPTPDPNSVALRHLDTALGDLRESDRDVLLLRYFEQKSMRYIARTLGIEADAAQKRVSRALERLRNLLIQRGVTMEAGTLAVLLTNQSVEAAPPALVARITTTVSAAAGATAAGTTLIHWGFLMSNATKSTLAATAGLTLLGSVTWFGWNRHASRNSGPAPADWQAASSSTSAPRPRNLWRPPNAPGSGVPTAPRSETHPPELKEAFMRHPRTKVVENRLSALMVVVRKLDELFIADELALTSALANAGPREAHSHRARLEELAAQREQMKSEWTAYLQDMAARERSEILAEVSAGHIPDPYDQSLPASPAFPEPGASQLARDPNLSDDLTRLRHQLDQLEPAEAVTAAQAMIRRAPDSAEARLLLGNSYARLGDFHSAATTFDEALALAPNHPMIQSRRAEMSLYNGQIDEAAALWESLTPTRDLPPDWLAWNRFLTQLKQGFITEAERTASGFMQASAELACGSRAALLFQDGAAEEAEAWLAGLVTHSDARTRQRYLYSLRALGWSEKQP
jgi:RNA polymerase sigma factor (sigma-70 family)